MHFKNCSFIYFITILLLSPLLSINAQTISKPIEGKVIDAVTRMPIQGVTIHATAKCCCTEGMQACNCVSDVNGCFSLQFQCKAENAAMAMSGTPGEKMPFNPDSLYLTALNYETMAIALRPGATGQPVEIALMPTDNLLHQVIVTASRFRQNRADIPAAIGIVDSLTIENTKATQLDQLVNKVPGVFMVDLGNEQHEMSIRQPMTTQSLFLYLEDGMPIRTSGLYNHNALLEMNMAAMDRIEILKGPASAQYGPEAVGGAVNILTTNPPAAWGGKALVQADNNGYKRTDLRIGNSFGKLGLVLSGYYANRHDGPIDYSDFHKTALTLKANYSFSPKLHLENKATYIDYYADMSGSIDSIQFARKDFTSHYQFTNRKVTALRWVSTLNQSWNDHADSKLALMYRNNKTGQNPSYRIKDSKTDPGLATGEINLNSFESFVGLLQHRQQINWLQSQLIAGLSADISPSSYHANFIKITKNTAGDYAAYTSPDSLLAKYTTGINNYAAFLQWQMNLLPNLKITLAGRYDRFDYNFSNALPSTAVSGAPSADVHFGHWTPKVGFSYHLQRVGFYANYAQGFVPPQVTQLFNNVKVPFLKPQVFDNYEVGGWFSLLKNKLYADWSLYTMEGKGEIISVRNEDGSFENKNAGKTRHTGFEYGFHYQPVGSWDFQLSGTFAEHKFLEETQNGVDLSENQMSTAPHMLTNASFTYKPGFLKGLRIGAEWQQMGSYYMDDANTAKYDGFQVVNLRTGYDWHKWGVWVNALNLLDKYYADIASKSAYGYSYNLGNPFTLAVGLQYTF